MDRVRAVVARMRAPGTLAMIWAPQRQTQASFASACRLAASSVGVRKFSPSGGSSDVKEVPAENSAAPCARLAVGDWLPKGRDYRVPHKLLGTHVLMYVLVHTCTDMSGCVVVHEYRSKDADSSIETVPLQHQHSTYTESLQCQLQHEYSIVGLPAQRHSSAITLLFSATAPPVHQQDRSLLAQDVQQYIVLVRVLYSHFGSATSSFCAAGARAGCSLPCVRVGLLAVRMVDRASALISELHGCVLRAISHCLDTPCEELSVAARLAWLPRSPRKGMQGIDVAFQVTWHITRPLVDELLRDLLVAMCESCHDSFEAAPSRQTTADSDASFGVVRESLERTPEEQRSPSSDKCVGKKQRGGIPAPAMNTAGVPLAMSAGIAAKCEDDATDNNEENDENSDNDANDEKATEHNKSDEDDADGKNRKTL